MVGNDRAYVRCKITASKPGRDRRLDVDFPLFVILYCLTMYAPHRTQRVTATLAVVAFVLFGLLPAEHLHASGTPGLGEAIVHRHIIDGSFSYDRATLAHGDHPTAQFLTSAFETRAKFAPEQPVLVTALCFVAPDVQVLPQLNSSGAPSIHDPPLRGLSARAPPAKI